MEYLNDSLYLFENIKMGYAKYNWLIIDTLGNELERKLNYMPRFRSQTMPLDHNVFTNRYGIGYWNLFNDTIFDVQTNKGAYKFFFVSNNQRLTPENVDNELFYYRSSFRPYRILESDKYLFMQYFLSEKKGIALYDKSSRQFKCDESRNDDSSFAGFTNDLDGGLPFVPVYYYIRDNAEFMLGWSYAYEYKKVSISNELENFSVKFPEKKKELEALANRLNDNDNPVLMLVKLKE